MIILRRQIQYKAILLKLLLLLCSTAVSSLAAGIALPALAASSKPIEFNSQNVASNWVAQGVTRITGVRVNQTESGLALVLETITGSERLSPTLVPEGNDLVIDIPNATLAFPLRDGVTELNPAPGIRTVTVNKTDDNNIRVRITGEGQVPTAEVTTRGDNLVFSLTPQSITADEELDEAMQRGLGGSPHERLHQEEIELVVTPEAEDNYYVPDASITRTDAPIINIPGTVQVVPREVFEDQGVTELNNALSRNAVGVVTNSAPRSIFNNVLIRGFDVSSNFLRNGIPETFFTLTPPRDLSNVERLEVFSGPASVIGGQISPGGIVNIVTKQPLPSPFYELSASYGSFNTVEGALDFSSPLNDSNTLGYRLNTSIYHSDTLIDIDDVDIDRFSVAPVLSWQINEQTQLSFEGLYLDAGYSLIVGLPARGTVLNNPNGEVSRDQFLGEPNVDGNDR